MAVVSNVPHRLSNKSSFPPLGGGIEGGSRIRTDKGPGRTPSNSPLERGRVLLGAVNVHQGRPRFRSVRGRFRDHASVRVRAGLGGLLAAAGSEGSRTRPWSLDSSIQRSSGGAEPGQGREVLGDGRMGEVVDLVRVGPRS